MSERLAAHNGTFLRIFWFPSIHFRQRAKSTQAGLFLFRERVLAGVFMFSFINCSSLSVSFILSKLSFEVKEFLFPCYISVNQLVESIQIENSCEHET